MLASVHGVLRQVQDCQAALKADLTTADAVNPAASFLPQPSAQDLLTVPAHGRDVELGVQHQAGTPAEVISEAAGPEKWQLSEHNRSRSGSVKGSSLVFVNTHTLFRVFSDYGSAVADRLQTFQRASMAGLGIIAAHPEPVVDQQPQQNADTHKGALRQAEGSAKEPIASPPESSRLVMSAVGAALQLVQSLEEASLQHCYTESLMQENSEHDNELYTDRQVRCASHRTLAREQTDDGKCSHC